MEQFTLTNVFSRLSYWLVLGLLFLVCLGGLAVLVYGLVIWYRHRNREKQSLEYVLLQISLPANNEIKIDAAEQMFASLSSLRKGSFLKFLKLQPHFTLEIVAKNEDIRFYVSVHKKIRDMMEKQINAAYPSAEVIETPEHNIFSPHGRVAFTELEMKDLSFRPLTNYRDLPTDPLSGITSAMARLAEGESAAVQIVVSAADSKWRSLGRGFIAKTKKNESDPEKASFKVDAKALEAIENKTGKPGFETAIRLVVCSDSVESAKAHLSNLKSAFTQFNSSYNRLGTRKIWIKNAFMIDFIYRYQSIVRFGAKETILSSEELATIFHFPNKFVETPHIHWIYSRRAPAPPEIPKAGLYLGQSAFRGTSRPVFLGEKDRRRHSYIIGRTGTGKSELMREMILQDINAGRGVCLIDPHDLAEDILSFIPPERAKDVIYFDPSDTGRPMGLNLLEAETEDQKHFVATSIINLMYKLFDPYKTGIVGPRFEHAIRNSMLTVMEQKGATFVELYRALQDPTYVQELLPLVKDPLVKRYWTDQIARTNDFHKSETLDYIVSKFGRFVGNKMMRNIIGQSKSAFDFRQVMDEGKILIINLAKGKIGEENSSFIGLVLVPRILLAAMSRTDIPEEQRRDFYLYVDEFQNFATPDFAQILSEARKYKLNLTVANQFVGQMEEEVKDAIFGNVGTKISFQIGVNDANYLQQEYQPTFTEEDLINIDRFHAYIKTVVDGEPVPAFSIDTTKDMGKLEKMKDPKIAKMIKELSRFRYGRDREMVEAEIAERAKL